jgi:hypothetical protein
MLVISGRDTPTLLDLVEEPLDQIARLNHVQTDAFNQYNRTIGISAISP